MRNYIFDLDGTLINSSEEILRCLEQSLKLNCIKYDKTTLTTEIIGPPIKQIIENLIPELQDEEIKNNIMKTFRNVYDNKKKDISRPYSGVEDLISKLKTSGKRLFVATNKPKIPTMRLVNKFFPNTFEDVYTIDKFETPMTKSEMLEDIIEKYGLNKEETIMIGDALSDITAAKNAGIKSIGVLWGYASDKTELIKHADYVIGNTKEIKWLKLNYQTT